MKFLAAKAWGNTRARLGTLQVGPVELETPSLLLSTRKGIPHFVPPDLLPYLPSPDSGLLQVSPLHFVEGISPKTISDIGGLHKLVSLPGYGMAAVSRDSIQCLPECDSTNKLGASFDTPCGRLLVILPNGLLASYTYKTYEIYGNDLILKAKSVGHIGG